MQRNREVLTELISGRRDRVSIDDIERLRATLNSVATIRDQLIVMVALVRVGMYETGMMTCDHSTGVCACEDRARFEETVGYLKSTGWEPPWELRS